MPGYTLVQDVLTKQPIPDDGILTRQLLTMRRSVLFTFRPDSDCPSTPHPRSRFCIS